jgi:hypothetical protein
MQRITRMNFARFPVKSFPGGVVECKVSVEVLKMPKKKPIIAKGIAKMV